jgi:hypothetical protein
MTNADLPVIDYQTNTSHPAPEVLYLVCKDIHPRFKEYCVMTSHSQIMDGFKSAEAEDLETRKGIFRSVYSALTKYTDEELTAHWEANSQEWQDWCNDVAIFYVYRRMLFETAYIPIVDSPNPAKRPPSVATN